MDKRLHIVVFLLFSLSAIVIMGSGDKTELLFHLLIVSILGFFSLYIYHKQTVENFVCDKKVVEDELDKFYEAMIDEEKEELKGKETLTHFNTVKTKEEQQELNGLKSFYTKLVERDPLVEFTEGQRDGNEEYTKDGDFKNFFDLRARESLNKFEGYDKQTKSLSVGAPLDNTIGEYDGVVIDAQKFQYRKSMMPGTSDCDIPPLDQKCGSLSAPCKGVKINAPFHVTPEGKEVTLDFGHTKPDKLNRTVLGHLKQDQNMFVFSHNKASPACCPST